MLKSSNELKPNTKISKIRTIIKIKTYGILGSSLMLIIGFLIFGILMIMSYFNIEINSNINNFFISMSILGLVFFILFFIYFIIKDPTNNIQKYQLDELIDFCTKSKNFTEYSEFITYIIYKSNRIANDSSRSRDEVEKIIARLFRKVYKENSVNSNQTAFKNLCINLLNTLKSTTISENDIFSLYDVDKFDNSEIVNFKNLFINCLLSYMNLKANILSFFCICFGVLQTKLENFPLDTYLYAAASMILIIYAIGTEIKKARETKTL